MYPLRSLVIAFLIAISSIFHCAYGAEASLLPKYGQLPKTDEQKAADQDFLAGIDKLYKGDWKKATKNLSNLGWQFMRQGNSSDAMRRFNQAWLIDRSNGDALWGMAIVIGSSGKIAESALLFAEAEPFLSDDIDFAVDYARTFSIAATQANDPALLEKAFIRFSQLYAKAPQHTLNLQNWAITLFHTGNYAEAWKKIKLAELTPRRSALDSAFIADLQAKMPRP